MENTDSFFDQPPGGDGPGFVVNGRYAIKHPDTGKDATWQRASNFGSPLADHYAIGRWQQRELIRGLNRREDVLELVRTATEIDNPTADAWITSAHEAAAIDAKANRGTAIHEVLRAYDTGQQYSERYAHIVRGYGQELDRQGLTPVGCEVVVLNVPLGAAGKLDRVYREREGSYVLGDVKTGRLDYAVHEYAVQLAVYATAGHLVDDTGAPRPLPWVLRQDYAVLVHVDPGTGESSTYRIDLTLARRAANLAVQVRAWRATKDVALPYVPPDAATREVDAAWAAAARVVDVDQPSAAMVSETQALVQRAAGTAPPLGEARLVYQPGDVVTPELITNAERLGYPAGTLMTAELAARVSAGIGPDGAHPLNPVQVSNLAVPGDGPRAGMPIDGAERTVDGRRQVFQLGEWMDFPPSQQPGVIPADAFHPAGVGPGQTITAPVNVDGWAGVGATARAAANTAPAIDPEVEAAELAKLPKTELQRMLRDLGGKDLAHHRKWLAEEIVKRRNAAGHPAAVTVGTNALGERAVTIDRKPPTPAPAAEQTPHTLSLIGAAGSVADLSRIREKVVSVGGDHAWTDEMTEAARRRAAELDAAVRTEVLARIDAATGSQELAALWAELTLTGTAPSHWTDEYQEHANARLNALTTAVTSAPPVNPFAN